MICRFMNYQAVIPDLNKYCYKLCIQKQMAVTHIFYFKLCQSSLFSTVISFVYKDKLWFDESKSVIYLLFGKYLKKNSFIPSPH